MQVMLVDYTVLGHSFKNNNHSKMGDYYGVYEKNQPLREFVK